MVVLVPSHLPEFASTSMAAVQLRLLPCPALCSRASASAGPSNIALAASHSPTNWPAAVADPSNSSHANSAQARGLSWSASCRPLPMQPQTRHSPSTPHQRPKASEQRAEAEAWGRRPAAKAPPRGRTEGRGARRDPQLRHAHRSSTRHRDDQEPQPHRFVSYRFRVCRHG